MKKIILCIIVLIVASLFHLVNANAEVTNDDKNWGIEPVVLDKPSGTSNSEASEKTWQGEHDEAIYDNYGSDQSPAFLNRENMNPNESDYGYGTPNGNE